MKNFKNIIKIFKWSLYILAGLAILIFKESVMPYVGYLVGGVVFAYSLPELIAAIAEKNLLGHGGELFPVLTQTLIGVLLILSADDITSVCIIWGVWSILREAKELTHAVTNLTKRRPGILNIAESVTVITMSFMMILTPTEHHAHTHVILLGIELICVVLFDLSEVIYDLITEKRKSDNTPAEADSEEPTEGETAEEVAAANDTGQE